MSLRINSNVDALQGYNNLNNTSSAVSKSMERLSSGFRINKAADDSAGLSISERMRGQIRGLAQAQANIGDGISMVQTAEAALGEVHGMLQRARELAVQYKNGSLSTTDQAAIASEIGQLSSEITRIGGSAKFNGIALFTGAGTVTFQVGANDGDSIAVTNVNMTALVTAANLATAALNSTTALQGIDAAINAVSDQRAVYGAVQNRLEYASNAQKSYHENLVAAESRIRDTDMAQEMVALTKNQVLAQAGTAMLSQANQAPQSVLSLLR
jgi:flagellin